MAKEEVKIESITLNDLSGGLNSNWLSSSMQDNEAKDANNVIWMENCLTMVPGWSAFGDEITGHIIEGIVDYRKRDGTQYLYVISDNAAYYWDTGTSSYIDVTGGLTISPNRVRSIVFNNKTISTNGADAPFTWDGGAAAVTLLSACGADIPPTTSKYISTFNGRVILLNYVDGATDRPTRACYSGLDNQNFWDLTFNYWEVDGDDGDHITGGSQLGDNFIIFTNNTINTVTGSGTPWTVARGFIKGVGCVSGDSIVHAHIKIGGNLVECLTFMSHDGPKAFDGSAVYDLPIPAANDTYKCATYFDTRNTSYRDQALSFYYPRRNWLGFLTTSNSDVQNDGGCYYDASFNSLWPFDNIAANCVARVWNPDTSTHDIYVGSYDGQVYILSESTHPANLDFVWESRYFDYGDEATKKLLRELVSFVSTISGGSLTISITYDKGFGGTSTDTLTINAGTTDWTLLDWTLVDWTSKEETQEPLDALTQDFFCTHNIKITGGAGLTNFTLNKFITSVKNVGKAWF